MGWLVLDLFEIYDILLWHLSCCFIVEYLFQFLPFLALFTVHFIFKLQFLVVISLFRRILIPNIVSLVFKRSILSPNLHLFQKWSIPSVKWYLLLFKFILLNILTLSLFFLLLTSTFTAKNIFLNFSPFHLLILCFPLFCFQF